MLTRTKSLEERTREEDLKATGPDRQQDIAADLVHLQKFTDKLSGKSGSTSTPYVQKSISKLDQTSEDDKGHNVQFDSGFAECSNLFTSKNDETNETTQPPLDLTDYGNEKGNLAAESPATRHSSTDNSTTSPVDDSRNPKDNKDIIKRNLSRMHDYLSKMAEKCPRYLRIGIRMADENVDIVTELHKRQIPCLSYILSLLDSNDLQNCVQVSKEWEGICRDKRYKVTDKLTCNQTTLDKENQYQDKIKSSVQQLTSREHSSTQPPLLRSISINELQKSVPTPSEITINKLTEFYIEGQKLKYGERLTKCPKCSGPAIVIYVQERGTCKRKSCGYDYCMRCELSFHNGLPCKVGRIQTKGKKLKSDQCINSKNSKQHLKRL